MAIDAGTIYSAVELRTGALSQNILQAQGLLGSFIGKSKVLAGGFASAFTTAFGVITKGAAAIAGLTVALIAAATPFKNFEQSIANVASVTRATGEDLKLLSDAAKEAGENTRFKASQAADALYYLGSAGLSATQSVDALNGVLMLAGATQSDLAFTAETTTAVLSQYGLQAEESTRISNVFAASIKNSQATMEKLSNAFKKVGPVAAGMGMSVEETAGALQVLFNAGFRGESSGRALASALADLASPTSSLKEKFAQLGISLDKVNPKNNTFAEIIGEIAKSGADTSDVIDAFGKVAGPQLAVLISKGRAEIERYTKAVTGTNAAAESYAIQNDTLAGDIDVLGSKAEAVAISFGEKFAPGLRQVVQAVTEFLNNAKPFIDVIGNMANAFLGFVGGIIKGANDAIAGFTKWIDTEKALNETVEKQKTVFETNGAEITRLQYKFERLKQQQSEGKDVSVELNDVVADLNKLLPETNKLVAGEATSYEDLVKQLDAAAKSTERLVLIEEQKQLKKQLELVSDAFVEQEIKAEKSLKNIGNANSYELKIFKENQKERLANLETFFKRQLQVGEITREQLEELSLKPFNQGQLITIRENLDELNEKRVKAIEVEDQLDAVVQKLKDSYVEVKKEVVALGDTEQELADEREERLKKETEEQRDARIQTQIEWQEYNQELRDGMSAVADEDPWKEFLKNAQEYISQASDAWKDYTQVFIELSKQQTEAQLDELERQRQQALIAAGVAEETEIEKLEKELAAAKEAGDQSAIDEKEKEIKRYKINEEFEKKKAILQYKAALVQWGLILSTTIAQGAQAIQSGFATVPFIPAGLIAGGIATGLAGLQVAAALGAKPKAPQGFQTGGIVPGNSMLGDNQIIAANAQERVLTRNDQAILSDVLARGGVANQPVHITVIYQVDSISVAKSSAEVYNNGIVTLKPRAIRG